MYQRKIVKLVQYIRRGLFPTICAGTHGYAIGYIIVDNFSFGRKDNENDGKYSRQN